MKVKSRDGIVVGQVQNDTYESKIKNSTRCFTDYRTGRNYFVFSAMELERAKEYGAERVVLVDVGSSQEWETSIDTALQKRETRRGPHGVFHILETRYFGGFKNFPQEV